MPYKVRKKCVYKKGKKGKKVGCTEGPINKYLAALHMHANESLEEEIDQILKEQEIGPINLKPELVSKAIAPSKAIDFEAGPSDAEVEWLEKNEHMLAPAQLDILNYYKPIVPVFGLGYENSKRVWYWEVDTERKIFQDSYDMAKKFADLGDELSAESIRFGDYESRMRDLTTTAAKPPSPQETVEGWKKDLKDWWGEEPMPPSIRDLADFEFDPSREQDPDDIRFKEDLKDPVELMYDLDPAEDPTNLDKLPASELDENLKRISIKNEKTFQKLLKEYTKK